MSGQAAVVVKNVMLPSSEPTMLRSVGRHQLFTCPHPMWRVKKTEYHESLCFLAGDLQYLEEVASFCEDASYLSPIYHYHQETIVDNVKAIEKPCIRLFIPKTSEENGSAKGFSKSSDTDSSNLVEYFEVEDSGSLGFQELSFWKQKLSEFGPFSEDIDADIFSVGCILTELHLRRPLFNVTSFTAYLETGILPGFLDMSVGRETTGGQEAFSKMSFGITIFHCNNQHSLVSPLSDTEAEWAYILLKEFLKCLKPRAIKSLVLPAIQKILQHALELLAFSRYLRASCISYETCDNTFGKGLCADGIDVLVRIGSLMGDSFIVKHILPFLRNVVLSSIDVSNLDKPKPIQSWNALAIIDSLVTLDGLAAVLPKEVVIRELLQDRGFLPVKVLMQTNLELPVLQTLAPIVITFASARRPVYEIVAH
ncbi:hypothetical protein IFM89_035326 [Coptis chinensis]|uniref:Uncharacterized protein n=1 Tax=Coptis chinensis TaxID=261450 RepID=A0A835LQ68_9MAGN|nr:hypothetical protein IFM89_035326 [Coptis chinensis]